jgi:hypothetical protein
MNVLVIYQATYMATLESMADLELIKTDDLYDEAE